MASRSDHFTNYREGDLKYEFEMLHGCRQGRKDHADNPFLKHLCIEGWLLHTRRLIEAFELDKIPGKKKWKHMRRMIAIHLTHSMSKQRAKSESNPDWDIDSNHEKLIEDLKIKAEEYRSYQHYKLLINLLEK